MHLRESRRSDISSIATIQAVCNRTDALARYFIHDPDKYWTTYRYGCWRFMRMRGLSKGTIVFVIETDAEDYESGSSKGGEVVGFAMWTREGKSAKAKEWQGKLNAGWFDAVERGLMGVEDRYHRVFTGVEHTFDHGAFERIKHVLFEKWDEEILGEAWELNGLFVHPDWQRKGLSKVLIDWGLQRGQEEMVPVVVKASPVGNYAYRRAGFQSIGEIGFGEYFDELEYGGELMKLYVWEPKVEEKDGVEGNWIERARKKREEVLKKKKAGEETKKEDGVLAIKDA